MDHKTLSLPGFSKCLMVILLASGFSAQNAIGGAPSPDDPPPPPPDVGAPTLPLPPILPRGHKRLRLSTGPVAPDLPVSQPQPPITVVKSLADKRAAIEKRRAK